LTKSGKKFKNKQINLARQQQVVERVVTEVKSSHYPDNDEHDPAPLWRFCDLVTYVRGL